MVERVDAFFLHALGFAAVFQQAIQVATRAERVACAGEDDGADLVVVGGAIQGLHRRGVHHRVQCVACVGVGQNKH
jgi:hypothetical protein